MKDLERVSENTKLIDWYCELAIEHPEHEYDYVKTALKLLRCSVDRLEAAIRSMKKPEPPKTLEFLTGDVHTSLLEKVQSGARWEEAIADINFSYALEKEQHEGQ